MKKKDTSIIKKKKFCEVYAAQAPFFNATKAAIAAGYLPTTATKVAYGLLKDPTVQECIKELRENAALRQHIKLDDIINRYAQIAFFDIRKIYKEDGKTLKDIHELDEIAAASIAGIEVDDIYSGFGDNRVKVGETTKIKTRDMILALDRLREVLGWKDKEKKTVRDGAGQVMYTEETELTDRPVTFE